MPIKPLLLTVGLFGLGGGGCSLPPSPLAPETAQTAQIQTQMVTVRVKVWDRVSQTLPILGAEVKVGGRFQALVLDPGGVDIQVPAGIEVTIRVDAPGYYGMEVDGTLNHPETWQFWMLKEG